LNEYFTIKDGETGKIKEDSEAHLNNFALITHLTQSFGKQKRIYHQHHEQSRNS
jgi:hypothetical protein